MTLVHSYQTGGDRPRVTVLVTYDDLLRGVAGATLLGSNTRISPSEARRLACDADILPAVMGSNSPILDLGRTTRLFTGDLRQAIVLRDRGCVFPGCHRDPRDCDAHHITPWQQGGSTSLDNAALLCPTHHQRPQPTPTPQTILPPSTVRGGIDAHRQPGALTRVIAAVVDSDGRLPASA